MHAFASAGPATGVFESLAAAIGAGLVIGGFLGGAAGFVVSRSRSGAEAKAVGGGYVGGAAGLLLLLIDNLMKHFV